MNVDFCRQIAYPVKRMKELVNDLDNLDFESALSWREFSEAMHEALDSYDDSCCEAEKEFGKEFFCACG